VIHHEVLRRLVMGAVMGLTAVALIYSPFGSRSGAHMNPAVTLAFLRLGKIRRRDAVGYVCGQFCGGWVGIVVATFVLGWRPADPSVNFIATIPGRSGVAAAFASEMAMAFALMTVVLWMASRPALARFTGLAAGVLVATFIAVEAPLSGMSMNPARTLGSNVLAGAYGSLWIYFTAPVLGMQLAAALMSARATRPADLPCPRLYHSPHVPCVFGCGALADTSPASGFTGLPHEVSAGAQRTPPPLAGPSQELM
jgi:aquaporin Z